MKIGRRTYHAADVLAGAYRGQQVEARALLVHTVEVDERGSPVHALCGYRKVDHLITDAGDVERDPTCHRCAERLITLRGRFSSKAELSTLATELKEERDRLSVALARIRTLATTPRLDSGETARTLGTIDAVAEIALQSLRTT